MIYIEDVFEDFIAISSSFQMNPGFAVDTNIS